MSFKTFTRSCVDWRGFSKAKPRTVETGLTWEEAIARCKEYNDNRTKKQIEKGTKLEFAEE